MHRLRSAAFPGDTFSSNPVQTVAKKTVTISSLSQYALSHFPISTALREGATRDELTSLFLSLLFCSPRALQVEVDSFQFQKNHNSVSLGADIDSVEHASRYLGHCRDVLKICTSFPSSLWALPPRPTQCSKTGLRMRNKKCQICVHPSNVRECY